MADRDEAAMDWQKVLRDADLKDEFLDRFDALAAHAGPVPGALEGLDGGAFTVDEAAAAVASMQEGTWEGFDPGLEAIIERFTRPVYLVQDATFRSPPDDFDDSEFIASRLEEARSALEAAIPSSGRIDLRNHRKSWAGTGWVVAPGVVVTNRHVAAEFADRDGDGFSFQVNIEGRRAEATLDWRREHDRVDEERFLVKKVLWIEPPSSFDVALLEIVDEGTKGEPQPFPIELLSPPEIHESLERWIAVVGYPARDSRNDFADQQRIFDGIYNIKRLAPGRVTAVRADGLIEHDATTLGGNSGSVVLDLETGRALAIHFGGLEGEDNKAVQASRLAEIVRAHA